MKSLFHRTNYCNCQKIVLLLLSLSIILMTIGSPVSAQGDIHRVSLSVTNGSFKKVGKELTEMAAHFFEDERDQLYPHNTTVSIEGAILAENRTLIRTSFTIDVNNRNRMSEIQRYINFLCIVCRTCELIQDILIHKMDPRHAKRNIRLDFEMTGKPLKADPAGDPGHNRPSWMGLPVADGKYFYSFVLWVMTCWLCHFYRPYLYAMQDEVHRLSRRLGLFGLMLFVLEQVFRIFEAAEWMSRHFNG